MSIPLPAGKPASALGYFHPLREESGVCEDGREAEGEKPQKDQESLPLEQAAGQAESYLRGLSGRSSLLLRELDATESDCNYRRAETGKDHLFKDTALTPARLGTVPSAAL